MSNIEAIDAVIEPDDFLSLWNWGRFLDTICDLNCK